MELSATTARPVRELELEADAAQGIDLHVAASAAQSSDAGTDGAGAPGDGAQAGDDSLESVVVHVQLRPRRPAVCKCLAALAALAAEHPAVGFKLTGLSKDDRVVRVTVGIDLGPRAEVAKFSASAQAAYLFVDGVFSTLYDYMPVYVAEPTAAERAAAVGVLDAVSAPVPFIPVPRRGEPAAPPSGSPARSGVLVPA